MEIIAPRSAASMASGGLRQAAKTHLPLLHAGGRRLFAGKMLRELTLDLDGLLPLPRSELCSKAGNAVLRDNDRLAGTMFGGDDVADGQRLEVRQFDRDGLQFDGEASSRIRLWASGRRVTWMTDLTQFDQRDCQVHGTLRAGE